MSLPRFSMVLPEGWEVYDFDPATQAWSVDRMVRRALGTSERLEPLRRDAARTYRRMLEGAAERGAFFGAATAIELDGYPVAASVLAFAVPAPEGADGSPPQLGVDQMLLDLSEPVPGEELVSIEAVELPVGRSARLRARVGAGMRSLEGEEPLVDVVRYFTPLPPAALLVTAFSTPSLHVADALGELFDVMALSVRLTGGVPA